MCGPACAVLHTLVGVLSSFSLPLSLSPWCSSSPLPAFFCRRGASETIIIREKKRDLRSSVWQTHTGRTAGSTVWGTFSPFFSPVVFPQRVLRMLSFVTLVWAEDP